LLSKTIPLPPGKQCAYFSHSRNTVSKLSSEKNTTSKCKCKQNEKPTEVTEPTLTESDMDVPASKRPHISSMEDSSDAPTLIVDQPNKKVCALLSILWYYS
jgi:hypothetical protein